MAPRDRVDILHVVGSLAAGGAERFVVDLVCELKRIGLAVGVAALSRRVDAAGTEMRSRLQQAGIPLRMGPTERVGAWSALWYARMMAEWPPLIVHLHTENTELAQYLAQSVLRRPPLIVRTLHTTQPSQQWLHRHALARNRAALSIACGPAVMERFATDVRGRLIAINNGVDFHWPFQNSLNKAQQKRELGWEPVSYDFVHVGGMRGATLGNAAKAHDLLVGAWRDAHMGARGARLHLVGDGNLRPELERLVGNDRSILFHGIQSDVWRWLLAADCFVMPSRFEGLPIAGIEAMGTGLPCIFSDIAPLRQLVGASVRHTTANDRNELARYLIEQLTVTNCATGEDVARVRDSYGIAGTAKQYGDAYAGLDASPVGNRQRAVMVS